MKKQTEVKENCMSWVVALGCLLMYTIILCPSKLSGLIFVVLIDAFQTDRKWASTPFFLFLIVSCSVGPFVGYMGQKFGEEKTTLLGFLIAAIGFGGMFFAESMIAVNVCIGVLYGIGLALGLALVPNILKKHFSKNINSATGVVFGGGCVGSFIFPPLAIYLFDEYGATGTFLIFSGLMLNGLPIVMMVMIAGKHRRPAKKPCETNFLNETKQNNDCSNEINSRTEQMDNSVEAIAKIESATHPENKFFNKEYVVGPNENSLSNSKFSGEKRISKPDTAVNSGEVQLLTGIETESQDRVSLADVVVTYKEYNAIQDQIFTSSDVVVITQQIQEKKNGNRIDKDLIQQHEMQEPNMVNKGDGSPILHKEMQKENSDNRRNDALQEDEMQEQNSESRGSDSVQEDDMQKQNRENMGSDTLQEDDLQEQNSENRGSDILREQINGNRGSDVLQEQINGNTENDALQEQINGNKESDALQEQINGNGESDGFEVQINGNRESDALQEQINGNRDCDDSFNTGDAHFTATSLISEKFPITKNVSGNHIPEESISFNNVSNNELSVTEFDGPAKNSVENTNKINDVDSNEQSKKALKRTNDAKNVSLYNSLKIFTNPVFLVLMVLRSLHAYILTMIYTTIIDYSRDKGIPSKYEVYFLMFYPIFDLVGRSVFVWLVDKGYVGYTMFQVVAWLISAMALTGVILVNTFGMLMTYAAIFALSAGAQSSLASGLVFKFIDKEECLMAMSSRTVLYVPLSFTSFPLIGYFRNELKSYDGLYYLLVAMNLLCCALSPSVEKISKARKRKKMAALEMEVAA